MGGQLHVVPHMAPRTSNRYQNFAIFMQLIACLGKKIAILRGARNNQNTYGEGQLHVCPSLTWCHDPLDFELEWIDLFQRKIIWYFNYIYIYTYIFILKFFLLGTYYLPTFTYNVSLQQIHWIYFSIFTLKFCSVFFIFIDLKKYFFNLV